MNAPKVSIVIPTLNEEKYLPVLLGSILAQDFQDYEIIVADKRSHDRTRKIAERFQCKLVQGGLPAEARNNGARVARGEWILFLDADVIIPHDFLAKMLREAKREKLGIATTLFLPISDTNVDRALHKLVFHYFQFMKNFKPMAPGFCILVKKSIHEQIHGFDEKLRFCEDHDYALRASAICKFGVLQDPFVLVSVRRLDYEKRYKIALKYGLAAFNIIRGKNKEANQKIRYEFDVYK